MTGIQDASTLRSAEAPVRGSLRLAVSTSSPQISAGSDFSIFVVIQNPFDVPITIHQVQTHIPVELVDVNALRLELAKRESDSQSPNLIDAARQAIKRGLAPPKSFSGIAIAVGTDFDPTVERDFVKMSIARIDAGATASIVGVNFSFPENPTSEALDRIFRRLSDYKRGLIPVQLQPGDSIVKQFVLRTRHWLLFTPLTHKFQIQVNYTSDGVDHSDTVTYEQSIRSAIAAVAIGAALGAILGSVLRSVSSDQGSVTGVSLGRALLIALLASMAVVVAFARKSAAQPLVSVEDFWGGALIGFTVGFFGFERFSYLFGGTPADAA